MTPSFFSFPWQAAVVSSLQLALTFTWKAVVSGSRDAFPFWIISSSAGILHSNSNPLRQMEGSRLGCEVLPSSFHCKLPYQAFFWQRCSCSSRWRCFLSELAFPSFTIKNAVMDCFPLSSILEEQLQLFDVVWEALFPLQWQQLGVLSQGTAVQWVAKPAKSFCCDTVSYLFVYPKLKMPFLYHCVPLGKTY